MIRNSRLLVGLGLVGIIAAGLIAPSRVRATTEQPDYDILDRLDAGVVVRRYGARLAAATDAAAGDDSAAFRRLAGFIFGGNRSADGASRRVAMTTPVEVAPADRTRPMTMRFFMPRSFTADTLPVPADPAVRIETVAAETVAVLRFAGSTREVALARQRQALFAALASSPWQADGEPHAYFYDAPFVPLGLRRNEVVVRVRPRD